MKGTFQLGRYSLDQVPGKRVSRSYQIHFEWRLEDGFLIEDAGEMRWVKIAQDLRNGGKSYQTIAKYFQEQQVTFWHSDPQNN